MKSVLKEGHPKRKLHSFFSREGYGADVRRLLTGTSLAQIINLACAPVLTRLYTPEQFGFLALFTSCSMVLSLAAAFSYESGVMLPHYEDQAWTLALLCVFMALITSFLTFMGLTFYGGSLAYLLNSPGFSSYIMWVPLGMFFLTVNRVMEMWLSRRGRYTRLAGVKVAGASTGALTKLGLGAFTGVGAAGLIAGMLICEAGKMVCAFPVVKGLKKEIRFLRGQWLNVLSAYSNFPRYHLWASLLEFAGHTFPIFAIASIFGPKVLGFYDLGFRLVAVPLELVIHSVRQVFYQNSVIELREKGNVAALVEKTGGRLVALGIVPFLVLAVAGPWIFSFVFGPDWARAGYYTQLLSPALFLRFVIAPILVFNTYNRQSFYLAWQVLHFLVVCLSLGLGGVIKDDRYTVALLSLGTCLTHLLLIYINVRLSKASLKSMLLNQFAVLFRKSNSET